ncbi:hypothetical protein COV18_01345 [Candidatus Woesearchaeota archaeon CG10_big_fil_rev_8_21_14_0_10_37_12]|nr:MAG: hypothetical protein COV18_01345 [Candidatus Woesearchaeota archaeon CG10_big_fil_rev_8_21_14_0_10_37_12]
MKHSLRVSYFLFGLFLLAQLFGLVIVSAYLPVAVGEEWVALPEVAGVQFERPDVEPQMSVWYLLAAILLGTGLIFVIMHFKKMFVWKAWFFLAALLCLWFAFAAFFGDVIAFVLAFVIAFWKVFRPNVWVHNASELFLYGGLAAIFVPMLNVLYAFILLLGVSLYDAYAVWKSKHMVKLAKFQTKSGLFAGLLIPYERIKRPKKGVKTISKKVRIAVLGGGDIAFPLFFSGAVLAATGFFDAVLVTVGASAGLLFLLYIGEKDRFYPAMPFLTVGCLLGFLLTLI